MDPVPAPPPRPSPPIEPADSEFSDRALVEGVLRNDRKAAARLVAAHADAVYAYARHRLAPRSDLAEDVVQDVFLAAFNNLATFQGQSTLRSWLLGIARHKVEDIYRERLRLPDDLDGVPASAEVAIAPPAVEDEIDAARDRNRIHRILSRLPERYAMVLLWRYWEQRSAREMAAAASTTEKSIERLLARARAQFKALWQQESGNVER